MNKKLTIFMKSVEYLLYTIVFVLISQGIFKESIYPTTSIGSITLSVSIVLFILFPIIALKWEKFIVSSRTILLTFTYLAFISRISLVPDSISGYFSFDQLFTIMGIVFAATGVFRTWALSFALMIAWYAISYKYNGGDYHLQLPIFSLVISFIVFLFSYIRGVIVENEKEKILKEELNKQRTVRSLPTNVDNNEDTEEFSELSSTSKKFDTSIGKELDNVIYSIDSMYQPQSILAFVYNTKNREFVLSSYRSRSGLVGVQTVKNANGDPVTKRTVIKAGVGIVGQLATTRKTYRGYNVRLYSDDLGYYSGNVTVGSIIAMPIVANLKGGLLGALVMDCETQGKFNDTHREMLSRFSRIASELIYNVILKREQVKAVEKAEQLYKISVDFNKADITTNEVLDKMLDYLSANSYVSRVTVLEYYEKDNFCRVSAVKGDTSEIRVGYSFTPSETSFVKQFVLNKGRYKDGTTYRTNFQKRKAEQPLYVVGETLNDQLGSLAIYAIGKRIEEYVLLVIVESVDKNLFADEEIRHFVGTIIRNAGSAYERAYLYKKMEIQATTDGLTGLSNHRNFQDNLHKMILQSTRYKRPLSLLLMDIDKFKSFNDTYGHQIGDLVLKVISQALVKSVRSTDMPARYGGEEFVVILSETDEKNALLMAERIRSTIEQTPINTKEHGVLHVTVSIGSATLDSNNLTQEQLIRAADSAMYQSKKNGRNRVTLYKPGMENEIE